MIAPLDRVEISVLKEALLQYISTLKHEDRKDWIVDIYLKLRDLYNNAPEFDE